MAAPPELTRRCPVCRLSIIGGGTCPSCHPSRYLTDPDVSALLKPPRKRRRKPKPKET